MKGSASSTCTMERSSKEPSSQNTISVTAKGLGERLMASDVPGSREAADREPRQHQHHDGGAAPRHRHHEGDGEERAGDGRERQGPGQGADEAEIEHEHGPEGRRLRRAEHRRVGERIAQQALQRRRPRGRRPSRS